MKGLIVEIYKNPMFKGCSNGGISGKVESVTIVGDGIPEIFEASDDCPAVKIVRRNIFNGEYVHAEPIEEPTEVGWMAGGAFIYSSDSRFRQHINQYPISLHDRQETQQEYDTLSK